MRLPFRQLAALVDSLYDTDHEAEVDARCRTIAELIEVCGWTEDDYWREWLSQECDLDNPPGAPYIERKVVLS